MIASIPSPPWDELPLIHTKFYGVMIAIGVFVALSLARRRWAHRGGDPDQISNIALWAVPFGLIGARAYHVITDWSSRYGCKGCHWWPDVIQIWKGGLGIPGGVALGALAGVLAARSYKLRVGDVADAMVPAVPLAQAIGRLGNWFNQELYGRPTTLPWGLEIDQAHRPTGQYAQFAQFTTFHPTFLYEGLWNIGLMFVLIRVDATRRLRIGKIFPLYVFGYFAGRWWVESLRIDFANRLFGHRVNDVVSPTMMVIALIWALWGGLMRSPEDRELALAVTPWTPPAADATPDADASSGAGDSEPAVVGEDGVAETGPEVDGPSAEVGVTEGDDAQADLGIDPHERA